MKRTLRRKFVIFAMSAVTVLLVVLVSAINVFSWIILERQSDRVLHTLANGEGVPFQNDFPGRGQPIPPVNMDIIKSTRFFMVRTDSLGNVLDVNVDQISSVTEEQAARYAEQVRDVSGKIEGYKYEVQQYGNDHLIFFMDTAVQIRTFVMVFSVSSAIALICWFLVLIFAVILSGRVVRPVLEGMEKQKQFITNAGHELKTPLSVIQSNNDASALIYGETKYSKNIRLQIKRLSVLMNHLLTLSKLDEEAELPVQAADISEMAGAMLPDYEAAMAQKKITVSTDIQPGLSLKVHRDTFSQMLSALLDNAVKYTPDGGTIFFAVRTCGGHIEITEENSCEEPCCPDPERLFERFYRGDNARTQNGTSCGYGIGLSAARAIAETFGGRLTASYPEHGKIRFTARF